jgi:hypothetical protein
MASLKILAQWTFIGQTKTPPPSSNRGVCFLCRFLPMLFKKTKNCKQKNCLHKFFSQWNQLLFLRPQKTPPPTVTLLSPHRKSSFCFFAPPMTPSWMTRIKTLSWQMSIFTL